MKLPSLHNLYVFSVAAKQQSFRLAASCLYVTPGAISRQVRALEEELGVQLFLRVNQRVLLTDAGIQLQQQLQQAFAIIADATQALQLSKQKTQSMLTITVLPSVYQYFLKARLSLFHQQYPHISIKVIPSMAVMDLADKQLDFGIRNGDGKWPDLMAEVLQVETLFPVVASSLYQEDRQLLLQKQPLLNPYDDWARWFAHAGLQHSIEGISYPDKTTLVSAVLAEKGIALLPELLSRDLLQSGHLHRVPGPSIEATRNYYLVWPAKPLSIEATLFRDWILGLFR